MKKFLLCMLLTSLMMPVIAQEKVALEQLKKERTMYVREAADLGISTPTALPLNPKGALIEVDGWVYAGISKKYDRQSQGSIYPQTQVHDDGFIGATWTNDDNPPFELGGANLNRGVAYSFSTDGGETWSESDLRVGGLPLYWPSYAQWGSKGEAILARCNDAYEYQGLQILNGLVLLTREKRGEGEWTIAPVPYPEGHAPNNYVMAWARMTTSGDNHQYIHIMSPMRTPETTHPTYYYRTHDGVTWDVEGKIISEVVGHEWDADADGFSDGINFASRGNTVACCFMSMGSHGYVLKSTDNGDTWKSTQFYDSPVRRALTPADYADTIYAPVQGCIALDNNDMVHLAFSVVMVSNSETTVGYFSGFLTTFLTYWNENMNPIDGGVDFIRGEIDPLWDDYFDGDLSDEGKYYVNSTVPKMPIIGCYTPTLDEHIMIIDATIVREWGGKSYWQAGGFSFPQMAFDRDNTLHLVYLGYLDNGSDDNRWMRHPYYTTRNEDGIWTQTEYLVNSVDLIDREFAYLTLAGLYGDKMHLMAQVDQYAGTFLESDHEQTTNYYYFFNVSPVPTPPITAVNEIDYTPLTLNVYPNPTSGQVKVNFEGKGNITIYNMLGQTVYHVENVENQKDIPLNNMATGVYFVTVRSGNATATQKLIVK